MQSTTFLKGNQATDQSCHHLEMYFCILESCRKEVKKQNWNVAQYAGIDRVYSIIIIVNLSFFAFRFRAAVGVYLVSKKWDGQIRSSKFASHT